MNGTTPRPLGDCGKEETSAGCGAAGGGKETGQHRGAKRAHKTNKMKHKLLETGAEQTRV